MKAQKIFLSLLLFLFSLITLASGMQNLGFKHDFEHKDKLVEISSTNLFAMGADFCEHDKLSRMPLFYPDHELIIGIGEKDFEENLYHFWSLEEKEKIMPCDVTSNINYYYLSAEFINHDYEVSLDRQKIYQTRKTSYWHNVFKDQISQIGFEFIEAVTLKISGITYYYQLENKNISNLIDDISMDLFARLILEPMLLPTHFLVDVSYPKLTLSNSNYKTTLRPGACMRHCASCLAEFIFNEAKDLCHQKSFAPFEDVNILNAFKDININYLNKSEFLSAELIQELIDYYLKKLKTLAPTEYEKYQATRVEALNFR